MPEISLLQKIVAVNLKSPKIIVSACLLGINCRYDGKSRLNPELKDLLNHFCLIPVCPEQLGGLPTPRPAAEIWKGTGADVLSGRARVLTNLERLDVTGAFLRGAGEILKIVRFFNVSVAILQQRSPSCGFGKIYQNHQLATGNGVTGELLVQNGITIFSIH